MAENERKMLKQKQTEGIRIAKLKGVQFGRPKIVAPPNFGEIKTLFKSKSINTTQACQLTKLTRGTFYRMLKRLDFLIN